MPDHRSPKTSPSEDDLVGHCSGLLAAAEPFVVRTGWWSCAEIALPDVRLEQLRASFSRLPAWEIRNMLGNTAPHPRAHVLPARWRSTFTWSDCLVLPLILLMAEELRRRYEGGGIYEHVAPGLGLRAPQLAELFGGTGHPTTPLKEALRSTASRLNMRNHFTAGDEADPGKPWYRLLWLQAGPGRFHLLQGNGRVDRQGSVTARSLAGMDGKGQRSEAFVELLQELQRLRGLFAEPAESERLLRRNPWILPEWVERLITRAAARDIAIVEELADSVELEGEGESVEPPLLANPRVAFASDDTPRLLVTLTAELYRLCGGSDSVRLEINGKHLCQMVRDGEGVLRLKSPASWTTADRGTEEIELDPRDTGVSVRLVAIDADAMPRATGEIDLWSRHDAVTAFDMEGRRLDDESSVPPSVLIVPAGSVVQPPEGELLRTPAGPWSIVQLALVLPTQLRVVIDDHVVWSHGEERTTSRNPLIDLFASGTSSGKPPLPRLGQEVSLTLRCLQPGYTLLSARNGAGRIERFGSATRMQLIRHRMPADRLTDRVSLSTLLSSDSGGRARTARASVNLNAVGAVLLGPGGRSVLGSGVALCRHDAAAATIEVGCDPSEAGAHGCWVMLEGDRYLGRLGCAGGEMRLRNLLGLGEPLVVKPGPFNPPPKVQLTLAGRMIDPGLADRSGLTDELPAGRVGIRIRGGSSPTEFDRIICLDAGGQLWEQRPEAYEALGEEGVRWVGARPPTDHPLVAVAAASGSRRLGASWNDEWALQLRECRSQHDLRRLVHALLWMRLPLLSNDAAHLWGGMSPESVLAVLGGLLQPSDISVGSVSLEASPKGAQWVARRLLLLLPEVLEEHPLEVVEFLGGDPVSAVRQLASIDPVAAVRAATAIARATCTRQSAPQQAAILVAASTGIHSRRQYEEAMERCHRLLQRIQRHLDDSLLVRLIDPVIKQGQGGVIPEAQRHNVAISLSASREICLLLTYGVHERLAITMR